MPVDKFGHTDSGSGSMQRVVAGGVTLTQVNNTFVRLDGTNAFVGNLNMGGNSIENLSMTYTPAEDNDLTTKKYADEQDATKVSKTGDTMTGNLFLNVGVDRVRTMGCKDLRGNKQFVLLLGSTTNKMQCQLNVPITLQTTDGFLCKHGETDIIRFGKSSTDRRIELYQNIVMNEKYIVDLHDPAEAQDAATKNYVDKSWKKCHVGYIPNLESNYSMTGFVASASSNTANHEAYRAFNNLGGSWFSAAARTTSWLEIKCPEPVIIWRLAVKLLLESQGVSLTASNDGITFTPLLATAATLPTGPLPTFFNISTTTAYQYYKLTVLEDDWLNQGIDAMQLYVYNT